MSWRKTLLGIGAAAGAAEYGLAAYFFRRTMVRQNAKTKRTMDMAGTDWDKYMPQIKAQKEWLLKQPRQDVWIRARDGLRLHGTYFPGEGRHRLIIALHGYTSKGMSDFTGLSGYYLERGYSLLLVDERAHGDSQGTYIGFGTLDRLDALKWIEYALEKEGNSCQIWLHGVSMGGAAVLMASGFKLPGAVKGIISDCAFTSAWDVFTHVLKDRYHLPSFPIMEIADHMAKRRAGYSLRECSAAKEVKKAEVPILFIHGDADTFVPCSMCREIFDNCASEKDMLIVHGAGHCECFYKDRDKYEKKLTAFLEKERTAHSESDKRL